MRSLDATAEVESVLIFPWAIITGSVASSSVDTWRGSGRVRWAVMATPCGGVAQFKLQESLTGASWSDIPGITIPNNTASVAIRQLIEIATGPTSGRKRYQRLLIVSSGGVAIPCAACEFVPRGSKPVGTGVIP